MAGTMHTIYSIRDVELWAAKSVQDCHSLEEQETRMNRSNTGSRAAAGTNTTPLKVTEEQHRIAEQIHTSAAVISIVTEEPLATSTRGIDPQGYSR